MNSKNILFIFEGESGEVKLFKHIVYTYYKKYYNNIFVYSYGTSIYELYDEMYKDTYLSLPGLLLEKEKDIKKKLILKREFNEIFLVFDFDPHYQKYGGEKIINMLSYMNDETDDYHGKLYINYPMLESYKHLKQLPDYGYKDYFVYLCDCVIYKTYVKSITFLNKMSQLHFKVLNDIIRHNLRKLNYILNNSYTDLTYKDYNEINFIDVLKKQIKTLEKEEKIYVLNTSIFFVIDFINSEKTFKLVMNN